MGQARMTTGCPSRTRGEGKCPSGGYCWRTAICKTETKDVFVTPSQFEGTWETGAIASEADHG